MEDGFDLSAVKALFIDIGGVLLTNGWPGESRQTAARIFNVNFAEMEKRHDLMFNMYEGGRVSMDVYLDTILFYQDRPFSKEAFRAYMFEQSKPLEEMLEGMLAWKESYPHLRIFSLNNEPKELHAYRVNHFQLRRLYDGFVASCDVGLRKPDPAIYALAAGIAGVQPSECLYIDDRDVLAAAGRKAGLQARTHHTATETLQFLQGL